MSDEWINRVDWCECYRSYSMLHRCLLLNVELRSCNKVTVNSFLYFPNMFTR